MRDFRYADGQPYPDIGRFELPANVVWGIIGIGAAVVAGVASCAALENRDATPGGIPAVTEADNG